jgi:hypothetical protein
MTDLEMRNILKGEFNEWMENFKEYKEIDKDYDVQDLNNYLWETVDHDLLWELEEDNFSLYDSLRTWDLLKELGLK